MTIELIPIDRFDRNNAYSLWLARDAFADGALLVNGDTVHPIEVEQTVLAAGQTRRAILSSLSTSRSSSTTRP